MTAVPLPPIVPLAAIRLGSAVLVRRGSQVLLGRRGKEPNYGKWVLPGGKIELFESINEAAIREVKEETGLAVVIERRLGIFEIVNPPTEHRVIVFSEASIIGGDLAPSSDLLDARFFDAGELVDLDVSPFVTEVLATVIP